MYRCVLLRLYNKSTMSFFTLEFPVCESLCDLFFNHSDHGKSRGFIFQFIGNLIGQIKICIYCNKPVPFLHDILQRMEDFIYFFFRQPVLDIFLHDNLQKSISVLFQKSLPAVILFLISDLIFTDFTDICHRRL